jgi:predicted nucleic acid-binding protein
VTLVDTSVWIEHLRVADRQLAGLLLEEAVLCHPFVVGERVWTRDRRLAQAARRLGVGA